MTAISSVKIERLHRLNGESKTKAFCDISIMDTFIVKGLKIVDGKDGLFVSMPSEQGRNGQWFDTFFPLSKEARTALSNMLIDAFNKDDRSYDSKKTT